MISLISLSSLGLTNCTHEIPDVPICVEITENKGYCQNTISDKAFYLHGIQWHNMKAGSMVLPLESWAPIKKFILDVCKSEGKCDHFDELSVESKVNNLKSKIE